MNEANATLHASTPNRLLVFRLVSERF
jgi:hypothetical protein